ncbi:alpha/beta fold hydrolase [Enhydrobacter aerosaccus]|uniref:alpha/beta fold hydrolase n=1 Tax=Enhydrobacter aerosaccus TaxID=225324 RepID=UPI000A2F2A93|nr:alpha/beta hydrolase [Enhydrobacter aerosaccus]
MRVLDLGGRTFSYLDQGAGQPLVLLHGIGSAARSFDQQVGGLSGRWRVVAWDAPGYGGSSDLAIDGPTAADYAEALLAFLTALDIRECHLLGHSLGCLTAARFCADHPDRVLSLTLCSIAGGHGALPEPERLKLLEQRIGDVTTLGAQGMAEKRAPRLLGPTAPPGALERVIDTMGSVRASGYGQAARMLSTGEITADIKRLPSRLSGQVIFGDNDLITPPARNRAIAAQWPGAEVHVVAGAGHALYLEQPDAFNELVANFLSKRSGTST